MTEEIKVDQSKHNNFDKYLFKLRSAGEGNYTHTRIVNKTHEQMRDCSVE